VVMRTPVPRMTRRGRVTVAVLIGAFLFFTLLGWAVEAWTDWLWFEETNYTQVFTGVLLTRVLLFLIFGLAVTLIVAGNLYLAYRLRPILFPHSPEQQVLDRYRMILTPRIGTWITLSGGLIGLFAGLSAQGNWTQWMLFANKQPFGVTDPQFGVDVGFYIFEYPFWRYLLGAAMTTVVLSLLGALSMHYVYGGVRLTGAGDRMTTAARAHVTTLVAVFVLLKAAAYVLDRRGLLLGNIEGFGVTGAGYSAVNALLPAKEILAYISIVVAIAIVVFSNAFMRNLVWPGISLALLVISAIAVGGIYPWAVQTFTVNPSLRDKEAAYIQRSIEATRAAYGLTDTKVTSHPASNLTPPAALATDTSIVPNIRLLDPAQVSDTYTQLQQVRGFYDFGEKLDIDRYTINGRTQDYVVGVRELDPSRLVGGQRNWLNRHTVFTHGYGLVAAPANQVGRDGQPCFVSGFLGGQEEEEERTGSESCSSATEQIPTSQPRVYYGERLTDYAIVGKRDGGRDVEFDRPAGAAGDQYYTYQGTGGVEIGSWTRRLLFAAKYREVNFLLSEAVNENSKILYERDPRSRVEKVAPFLTLDGDPYPAVVDGRIVWIVDGYTTASTYPYADRINLQQATNDSLTNRGTFQLARQSINYIRNSVKATVDAYDGTVTLYAFDDTDPVLKAWNQAFGGDLVKPRDQIPQQLQDHFRYPADLFKVQRDLLARFHVTEANEFFSGQNFWDVPEDPAQPGTNKQPPYYLLTRLPGQEATRFQLVAAVTPVQRQNLAALISGSYVDGKPRLEVLELPPENRIPGPGQAQQQMENNAEVRETLTLLQSETSTVVKGNLLSLPFGGGMLYVEPIYLKSNVENPYPLLKKVLLNYGDRVAFADTLDAAIKQLVESGGAPAVPPGETPSTGQPPDGVSGDLAAAAADVRKAIDEVRAAQQSGDFERYGRALANLDAALKRFEEAQRRAGVASPGPTPSPSPDSSPSPGS